MTPSDSTGAIGPSNYVEFVNSEIAVYSNTDLSTPAATLDESTFVGDPSAFTCDPQIQWDEQGQRWLYAALDCGETAGTNSEQLYFGWSTTSSPSLAASNWCQYSLNTKNSLEDYPKLGHDDSQIIIGTNAFDDGSGNYLASHIFVFDKPKPGDTSCPTSTTEQATMLEADTSLSNLDFTPVPANIADSSADGYVVAANFNDMSHLDVYTIGRNAGSNAVLSTTSVTVPAFDLPAYVPQPGTSDVLDSSDTRLTQAVAITDPATGKEGIWTQHTVAGSGGGPSVVRWYELTPGASTPTQTGTVSGPGGAFAFNGAVSPSADGQDAAVFYNSGSSSRLVDWRVQDRHADTTTGTTIEDLQLATSSYEDSDLSCPSQPGGGSSCRWGDYAAASPDPSNANLVWGTSMLTAAGSDSSGTPQWGTQNAAIDVTPASQYTLGVTTSGTGSGTVSSNPAGVTCSSTCSHDYTYGTAVGLTATPATGSTFAGWSGACSGTGACSVTMGGPQTVNATFTLIPAPSVSTGSAGSVGYDTATLTGSVNPNGSSVSDCHFSYSVFGQTESTAPCTVLPGAGTSNVSVSVHLSGLVPGSNYVYHLFATNAGGTGHGQIESFSTQTPLTVSKAGTGTGTVTSSPTGIDCGSTCIHGYTTGASVTLTPTAAAGSTFSGWTGPCTTSASNDTCVVQVLGQSAVTATFVLVPEKLTVAKRGHGHGKVTSSPAAITCGTACSESYTYGSSVTLTAKPAKGSKFVGWSGACTGKTACTLSMTRSRFVFAAFSRPCLVPKVTGKRLRVAKHRIKASGCRVGKIRRAFSAKVKKGHVIAQKPKPHRRRKYRAKVQLVVSRGRKH